MAMRAWERRSKKKGSNAPHVVEQLLVRLVKERDAGNRRVKIETRTYNLAITAWSQSSQESAPQRAEELLTKMIRLYELGETDVRPDRTSFNAVIKAYVKYGPKQYAVKKVESLIDQMKEQRNWKEESHSNHRVVETSPDRRGYNLLLYSYSISRLHDAGRRAQSVLDEMCAAEEAGDQMARPNINTYNLVIKCWALGRSVGFEDHAQAVFDRAVSLSDSPSHSGHCRLTHETFNAIVACWLKSRRPEAQGRVLDLLQQMEDRYARGENQLKPDTFTVNSAVRVLLRNGDEKAMKEALSLQQRMVEQYGVKPDVMSNNILIDGWSKSETQDAPQKALEILCFMEDAYKAGDTTMKPDQYSYTGVIDAFARSKRNDASKQALGVLNKMKDLHINWGGIEPVIDVYNACLNALAESRSWKGAKMSLDLLNKLENDNSYPDPSCTTYNTALKALRLGDKAHTRKAVAILERLEENCRVGKGVVPDTYSYCAVINVIGRSTFVDKAQRVFAVLQRMIDLYENNKLSAKPNLPVFNAALNAYAFSTFHIGADGIDAFTITERTLALLQKYDAPDHITYGSVLRACSNLLTRTDVRRDEIVQKMFERARSEGLVSQMVLTQLRFAASNTLYEELTNCSPDEPLELSATPREWRRNVMESRRNIR